MLIKIEGIEMAHSEASVEIAAEQVAKRFNLVIEITGETAGGGWPTVNLIGTVSRIQKALTEESGWSTGDEVEDAEMLFHFFREAKVLIGG